MTADLYLLKGADKDHEHNVAFLWILTKKNIMNISIMYQLLRKEYH